MPSDRDNASCLACGQPDLREIPAFPELPRISSDCRPCGPGGRLAVCGACGMAQKPADEKWLGEIDAIYRDYAAYSLAEGEEQVVFDSRTGTPLKRSDVMLGQLAATGLLPAEGRALDVGCGHGVTLLAMSRQFPGWALSGHELGTGNLEKMRRIPRFSRLHTGDLDRIDETFDFVSMIHSLEHFVDPLAALRTLRPKVAPGGHLFIEVCNTEENPFDLLIADHRSHFSPRSLAALLERAGFSVTKLATGWVKKEISLLATPAVPAAPAPDPGFAASTRREVEERIRWLRRLLDEARAAADGTGAGRFGLFGTSIAASWLASVLGDRIAFFVDEDPHRIGRSYLGKPVLSPQQAAPADTVFLALAPVLAAALEERFRHLPLRLIRPTAVS